MSSSSLASLIEDFYGVYLLVNLNPVYTHRTYIGFTTDPNRRIKQHNGECKGGAKKTRDKGPWKMVLITHGFPNKISALRFEWAWQHPKYSRRLKNLPAKKSSERLFDYNIRLLAEMLNTGPWNRLPLTVRWLKPEVKYKDFPAGRCPPSHMPTVRGPVKCLTLKNPVPASQIEFQTEQAAGDSASLVCAICIEDAFPADRLQCLSPRCGAVTHVVCLAKHFTRGERSLLPVRGQCPVCDIKCLWGDVVRKRKGVGRRDEERAEKRASKGEKEKKRLGDIQEEEEEEEENRMDVTLSDEDLFGED